MTRPFEGTPLTPSQKRVLAALVAECPAAGSDTGAREVAARAGARLGAVVVVLQSLAKKGLAVLHDADDAAPDRPGAWSPTMNGRSRVRHLPGDHAEDPAESDPASTDPPD